MRTILYVISFSLVFFLSGCSTITPTITTQRTPVEVVIPDPLELEDVAWTSVVVDGKTYAALDGDNLSAEMRNEQAVQDRLNLYYNELVGVKGYYK